jgi:hypothetical protein
VQQRTPSLDSWHSVDIAPILAMRICTALLRKFEKKLAQHEHGNA